MGNNQQDTKKLIRWIFIFALFFVGASFVIYGNLDSKVDDNKYKNILKDLNHIEIAHPIHLSNFPSNMESRISLIKNFNITFTTEDVFTVKNPINYNANATINLPNGITRFGIVVTNPNTDLSWVNNYNVESFIDNEIKLHNYIELHPISPTLFFDYGQLNISTEGPLSLFILTKNSDGIWQFVSNKDTLFQIYPYVQKVQYDTNIALQNQIIETAKSNADVMGLTFVIIGLVPIGLAFEIIIHRYLTGSG